MSVLKNLIHSIFIAIDDNDSLDNGVAYSFKGKFRKTFSDESVLTDAFRKYVSVKINSKDLSTDILNNIEIHHAMNAFYIDLDSQTRMKNPQQQKSFNAWLAKTYLAAFKSVIAQYSVKYFFFTFLCKEFTCDSSADTSVDMLSCSSEAFSSSTEPQQSERRNIPLSSNCLFKGGVHTLIFCNENFDKTDRKNIFDRIDRLVRSNEKAWGTICKYVENTDTLFDEAPIKSANILFPFAQKDPQKRQYVYHPELSSYNNEQWFVKNSPIKHHADVGGGDGLKDATHTYDNYLDAMEIELASDEDESDDGSSPITQPSIHRDPSIASVSHSQLVTLEANHSQPSPVEPSPSITRSALSAPSLHPDMDAQIQHGDPFTASASHSQLVTLEELPSLHRSVLPDPGEDVDEQITGEHGIFIVRGDIKLRAENLLCQKALQLFNFMSKIKYLSSKHPFWAILRNESQDSHNRYYRNIVQPYYEMIIMINLLESDCVNDFNKYRKITSKVLRPTDITFDILELVSKQMAYLCLSSIDTNSVAARGTKLPDRYSWDKQMVNMRSMFFDRFKRKVFDKERFDDLPSEYQTYARLYYTMKPFSLSTSSRQFLKAVKEILDSMAIHKVSMAVVRFQNFCKCIVDNFVSFIMEFCEGISTEITPFTRFKSYTHQTCYVNDSEDKLIDEATAGNEEVVTFCHVDPKFILDGTDVIDKTYIETMQLWFNIVLTFTFISNNFQLKPAIRTTIASFIKMFINVNMSGATRQLGRYKEILIYNIRQTNELERYPYNQWIKDSNASILLDIWATKLYRHFIENCLTQEYNDTKMYGFIKLFTESGVYGSKFAISSIKVLPNADKDLSEMLKDIIKTHPTESWCTPSAIDIEKSNIFPMRNGWLEFYWKSSKTASGYEENKPCMIVFNKNNRSKYTDAHTNIPWVGDIDDYLAWIELPENIQAKEAHEAVVRMFNQIYPVKEELDYNMAIFASVLYGNDEKNMIHVQYGTGADGKTTVNTAIFSMLDSEGYTNDVYIEEHGRLIQIESLDGLGSTMKAEALLVVSGNSGGHDEGGRSCMIHKRFISVAEPDQHLSGGNLNGAAIKELTGGGAIQARKIYKGSVSVQANCLITFQTNDFPGTDDTSRGFRRRLSVYPHRSKFRTNDELQYDKTTNNLEYIYPSDNALAENLTKNIYYKQAVFYFLLPYAKRNIENGWRSLQKIPKPQCVMQAINQVLSRASGITKWFCDNLEEYDETIMPKTLPIINLASMLEKMIKTNRENQIVKLWKKCADVNEENKLLIRSIQNYFEQQIFILQDKYYITNNKSKTIDKSNKDLQLFLKATAIDKSIVNLEQYSDLSVLQKEFLSSFAVNSVSVSQMSNYEDLFLVGYVLKKQNEQVKQQSFEENDFDGYE